MGLGFRVWGLQFSHWVQGLQFSHSGLGIWGLVIRVRGYNLPIRVYLRFTGYSLGFIRAHRLVIRV